MKKFLVIAVLAGLYQNWGSIHTFVFGEPEYKQLGGRGVPLVNISGTIIHGYSPERMREALP